jgi:hypothetical protein
MKDSYRNKIYKFSVPLYNVGTLTVKAIQNFEYINRTKVDLATLPEDKINHIIVNFIRHRLIQDYNKNYGSPSFEKEPQLYFDWFKAINHEIGEIYPFLKKTIALQISHKRSKLALGKTGT